MMMTSARTVRLLLVLPALMAPAMAEAANVQFCIRHTGVYTDAGITTEDYWTDASAKLARGAKTMIWRDGNLIFDGELGDGFNGTDIACTSPIAISNGTYYFEFNVRSDGHVQGNRVYVTGWTTPDTLVASIYGDEYETIAGTTQVVNVTIPVSAGATRDAMNVYQAAAYAMYRHAGGIQNDEIRFHLDDDHGGSFYCDHSTTDARCPAAATVVVDPPDAELKFLLIHEMGHWIGDVRTSGVMDHETIDVSYSAAECPGSNHHMKTEEYAAAAAGEGFGHFYSADVWNSHDHNDCKFRYWNDTTVNCQDANGSYDLAYHETNCGADGGHGVELDWLRAFWDVHTAGAAPDPSMNSIMSWLGSAGSWTTTSVYSVLNLEANGLNNDLEDNWNDTKTENGIDH